DYMLTHLTDAALVHNFSELISRDRRATAELLAHIAEVDARQLYAGAGYSSMYAFCVGAFYLSEDAAVKRITAARAARRFPSLLEALELGKVHLSAIWVLAPHLNEENLGAMIEAATHKRKSEIE